MVPVNDKSSLLRTLSVLEPLDAITVDIGGKRMINFSSNDYMGLSFHPKICETSIDFIKRYGVGSRASRLVCGNAIYHDNLERKFATMKGSESALLFNSGYQANISIFAAIADRKAIIFADKLIHNSLIQGIKLSNARMVRYRHGELAHLENLLEKHKNISTKKYVVTESIFSMEGDRTNLQDIVNISKKYGASLIVDDAHAIGGYGHNGMGLTAHVEGIDITISTFGKGMGSFGACITCPQEIRNLLINRCYGFIYTTALPPAIVGSIYAALELLPQMDNIREKLYENTLFLKEGLHRIGLDTGNSSTHIIPIVIGRASAAMELSQTLYDKGILCTAIRPPTVPDGRSLLRVSVSAHHSKNHMESLLKTVGDYVKR